MKKKTNIQLASRNACTGCAACASVCPTSSITMRQDNEGFLQPHIDADTCINCHKCEKTCPIVSPITIPNDFETQAYAAINKDEAVRMRSSSGGMFLALAKWTIEQGGVVFGARFNDQWEVVHDYTETLEGIEPFMRSKYVQSRIGDTFKQAKQFLEQGRWVLYSGTPCQIGGLKTYLHKDYDKLLTVDLICHGVPSPKVWREYLKWMRKNDKVLDVNFRDKTNGWQDFHQLILTSNTTIHENQVKNPYLRGFLQNVYLRRSCYDCQFKTTHRLSDITLADAWGIQNFLPDMYDDKGSSLVLIHSELGKSILLKRTEIIIKQVDIETTLPYNMFATQSAACPQRRVAFLAAFHLGGFRLAMPYINKDMFCVRIMRKLKKIVKKII